MNGQLPEPLAGHPLDHLGVAVGDIEAASRPYEQLGLTPTGPDEEVGSQGVRVRAFRAGPSLIELLAPTRNDSPIRTFLDKRGPGLHHVALRVEELESEIRRLRALEVPFLTPEPGPGRAGTRVIFIHPKWSGGVLIELVEHR